MWTNPETAGIVALLRTARRIAVVGLSPKPHRDSNRVAHYMQQHGYEIVPIYPRGEEILGERVYRSLRDVPGRVDLVNVFRQPSALAGVVDDALAIGSPALWFQLGCVDEAAARRARDAGLSVVMDRCLMVDHMVHLGRKS